MALPQLPGSVLQGAAMSRALDSLKQEVAMWEPHMERLEVTRDNVDTVDITEELRERCRESLKGCGTVVISRPKKGAGYRAKFVDGAIVYWVESE